MSLTVGPGYFADIANLALACPLRPVVGKILRRPLVFGPHTTARGLRQESGQELEGSITDELSTMEGVNGQLSRTVTEAVLPRRWRHGAVSRREKIDSYP